MFKIDSDKLAEIIRIYNNKVDPKETDEIITQTIMSDWENEGDHQEWLDGASAQEITDWLASFMETNEDREQEEARNAEIRNLIDAEAARAYEESESLYDYEY